MFKVNFLNFHNTLLKIFETFGFYIDFIFCILYTANEIHKIVRCFTLFCSSFDDRKEVASMVKINYRRGHSVGTFMCFCTNSAIHCLSP